MKFSVGSVDNSLAAQRARSLRRRNKAEYNKNQQKSYGLCLFNISVIIFEGESKWLQGR